MIKIVLFFWKKKTSTQILGSSLLSRRVNNGAAQLMNDIQNDDIGLHGELNSSFHNFPRMFSSDFEKLITLIGGKVAKLNTNFRDSISVKDRLTVTLRFFATGESYQSLMYLCKISVTSISQIIPEVCDALNEVYIMISKKKYFIYFCLKNPN